MDSDVISSIRTALKWTKKPNGPKYTATIERLFEKVALTVKADCLPFWTHPLPDIYIINFFRR